ncbi:CBS domain-containing protein [Hyphomicrobium sp.]|jgi:CBS domain-containing protein|uniref:CBS domain-containing protein n=1 Tax=Hyphomicrobium sp. TaxID=82 RepID=UPI002D128485|nr:CBS domain-containing protein [Hyphomicrobium sp.]HVZ06034.1 CBS domain-containing protein [Hyphomicrobium sp.]
MNVSSILKTKGSDIMTVRPTETVQNAAMRLRLKGVGALIVSNDGVTLNGIITERAISDGVAVHGGAVGGMHVSDLMITGVFTCAPSDSIADAARLMTNKRLRHLPVMDGGRLVGIVSVGDILKYRLDEVLLEAHVLQDVAIAHR